MKYRPLADTVDTAKAEGLREGGRDVLRNARARAPELTGGLKKSGGVSQDRSSDEVTVSFSDPISWIIHEKTELQHPRGGEAKFLENAALETDIAKPVADHVRAVLGG
jgi:hypothetical protein